MADQESEDDLSASRTSLERQAPHRGNTMVHVCWHRNTSVSMVDFSVAVEVPAMIPGWGGGTGQTRVTHPLSIWLDLSGERDHVSWPAFVPQLLIPGHLHLPSLLSSHRVSLGAGTVVCLAMCPCHRGRESAPVLADGELPAPRLPCP